MICRGQANPSKITTEPNRFFPKMPIKIFASRIGFRAVKRPFTSKHVDRIVVNLEGYEQTFSLALHMLNGFYWEVTRADLN